MSGGANIRERLFALGDERYAGFQSALIPNIPKETVIGVRMPMMRKLAKEIAGAKEMRAFLAELPHAYYDENILHSVLLSQMKRSRRFCRISTTGPSATACRRRRLPGTSRSCWKISENGRNRNTSTPAVSGWKC